MRENLLEGIIIGGTIGLSVVAIRMLSAGEASFAQALMLAIAGIVLCGLQIALSLRRARFRRPAQQPELPQPARRSRLRRSNPFAHEHTHNWTGLDDRLSKQPAQASPEEEQQSNAQDG